MRAKHVVPNAVTLANIGLGFLAIVAAAEGRFGHATLLLFFAALCDLLDGRLARLLGATSRFGMELDSLSDAISFGIAPALLVYFALLRPLGAVGIAVCMAYALCGVLRLARYNVASDVAQDASFSGAPIPVAAGYLLSFVVLRDRLPPWAAAAGTAWVAGCMVSTLKVPKLRKGLLSVAQMLAGLASFVVFLARPSALTWHVWNGLNVLFIAGNYLSLARGVPRAQGRWHTGTRETPAETQPDVPGTAPADAFLGT